MDYKISIKTIFEIFLESLSFIIQIIVGFLILSLSIPIIILKLTINQCGENCKIVFNILKQSKLVKRVKK